MLAQIGLALLQTEELAEAEPLLRECLAIREKTQPDVWSTFNTKSLLGGALLGQKKYAEAEPLLLAGYEGMKQREKTIPPQAIRLHRGPGALVQLYEATEKKDEAASGGRNWKVGRPPASNRRRSPDRRNGLTRREKFECVPRAGHTTKRHSFFNPFTFIDSVALAR